MKRVIPAWRERNCLQRALPEEGPPMPGERAEVAATDLAAVLDALNRADWKNARQRAQIRDLKKRLKLAERAVGMEMVHGHSSWEGSPEQVIVRAAVAACDLKKPLKKERRR